MKFNWTGLIGSALFAFEEEPKKIFTCTMCCSWTLKKKAPYHNAWISVAAGVLHRIKWRSYLPVILKILGAFFLNINQDLLPSCLPWYQPSFNFFVCLPHHEQTNWHSKRHRRNRRLIDCSSPPSNFPSNSQRWSMYDKKHFPISASINTRASITRYYPAMCWNHSIRISSYTASLWIWRRIWLR